MKKLMSMLAALAVCFYIVGCTPEQEKATAKQLGLAAAVTWVSVDNPTQEDIASMKGVITKIQEACCTNCSTDVSYYARVYPLVDEYITANVKPASQPMARLGAGFLLTSMDTAFAMNPSWKANTDKATAIVESFCEGAQSGLVLAPTDPVVVAANQAKTVRVKIKTGK